LEKRGEVRKKKTLSPSVKEEEKDNEREKMRREKPTCVPPGSQRGIKNYATVETGKPGAKSECCPNKRNMKICGKV